MLWILLWSLTWTGLALHQLMAEGAARSPLVVGVGALHLVLFLGLATLRPWARWLGVFSFGGGALWITAQLAAGGGPLLWVCALLFCLWATSYLLSTTTRDLVEEPGIGWPSLQSLAPMGILVLGATVIWALRLPWGVSLMAGAVFVLTYLVIEERLHAWISVYLSPRPREFRDEDEHWRLFRDARRARLRGDLAGARRLLERLPLAVLRRSRATRVLSGLIALDAARRSPPGSGPSELARVTLAGEHAGGQSTSEQDAALAEWIKDAELDALLRPLRMRASLIEGLLEDAADARSSFALQSGSALSLLSGEHFVTNVELGFRRLWRAERERQTGERGLRWLALRAWRAERYASAHALAQRAAQEAPGEEKAAQLVSITALALTFSQASSRMTDPRWREAEHERLLLATSLADSMGWLLMDSPHFEQRGVVHLASRFAERRALLVAVRELWDEFPTEAGATARWLLHLLADVPISGLRRRARFDRQWSQLAAGHEGYERGLISGMRASAEGMWEVAANTFEAAAAAAPQRTSAAYNHAFSRIELGEHERAEAILLDLTEREPNEAFWWLRLGDCRRQRGALAEALSAYSEAVKKEGLGGRVALRLGLTLVADGKPEEAERFLNAALDQANEPELIEQLAAVLEAEGAFDLARRYHHKAFLQQLERADGWSTEERDWSEEGFNPNGDWDAGDWKPGSWTPDEWKPDDWSSNGGDEFV